MATASKRVALPVRGRRSRSSAVTELVGHLAPRHASPLRLAGQLAPGAAEDGDPRVPSAGEEQLHRQREPRDPHPCPQPDVSSGSLHGDSELVNKSNPCLSCLLFFARFGAHILSA